MNMVGTIKKLQMAINMKGYKTLYGCSQFYSVNMGRPVNIYYIRNARVENGRVENDVLFKNSSQLRVVFFLRDILEMIGKGMTDIYEMTEIACENQKKYLTKRDIMRGAEEI